MNDIKKKSGLHGINKIILFIVMVIILTFAILTGMYFINISGGGSIQFICGIIIGGGFGSALCCVILSIVSDVRQQYILRHSK